MDSAIRAIPAGRHSSPPYEIELSLRISDPEQIGELIAYEEGPAREEFARNALKIGMLALRQARGQIDTDNIRREGEKLLVNLGLQLKAHADKMNTELTGALKEYFHPESGRFQERVRSLIRKDGELEEVLRRQIGEKDSELCRTLTAHIGETSPLMKILSPKESEGLLKSLSTTVDASLKAQRDSVLEQFSLDRHDSALSRLVKKLTDNNGELGKNLKDNIDQLVGEFSLDSEDSALSRMTRQLESASRAISDHLTLDKEESSLFRLKRELLEVLERQSKANTDFQAEVKQAIDAIRIRKEQAGRTTLHGLEFEQLVFEFLQSAGQKAGEVVAFVGNAPGNERNNRVGDITVELGADHAAAGAKIVIEVKDKKGYSLSEARAEIERARANRGAGVGVFVFARANAPRGLEPFQRLGDDIFVIWDSQDPATDIYLNAALMVARALCTRQAKQRESLKHDFSQLDRAVSDLAKLINNLEEIRSSAESINKQTEKILNRVRIDTKSIEKLVTLLEEQISVLKASFQAEAPA